MALGVTLAAAASACVHAAARVQAEHAREFGCEARWVRVVDRGAGRFEATGCGFRSEWACRERRCVMRDHGAFGVEGP